MGESVLEKKMADLAKKLKNLDQMVIAYSGGVDSDFLLAAAKSSGASRVVAVTIDSAFVTREEIGRAREAARALGVAHRVIQMDILSDDRVRANSARRCYFCKSRVFGAIRELAKGMGIPHCLHGVNTDDLGEYRPGLEASAELGFLSPLVEVGFAKDDVRAAARKMGLSSWDLPSQSCLATRIPHSCEILAADLERIGAAESYIRDRMGDDRARLRVRCHGDLARIETEDYLVERLVGDRALKGEVVSRLKELGFAHVTLDLEGYVSGSLNPVDI